MLTLVVWGTGHLGSFHGVIPGRPGFICPTESIQEQFFLTVLLHPHLGLGVASLTGSPGGPYRDPPRDSGRRKLRLELVGGRGCGAHSHPLFQGTGRGIRREDDGVVGVWQQLRPDDRLRRCGGVGVPVPRLL